MSETYQYNYEAEDPTEGANFENVRKLLRGNIDVLQQGKYLAKLVDIAQTREEIDIADRTIRNATLQNPQPLLNLIETKRKELEAAEKKKEAA